MPENIVPVWQTGLVMQLAHNSIPGPMPAEKRKWCQPHSQELGYESRSIVLHEFRRVPR